MSRYVVDLRSRPAADARVSGGKGAGLNRLARQRFNVPPGFVITTDALRDFLASLGPGSSAGASSTRESLQQAVHTAPLPPSIQKDIRRAYARSGGCVAVRSSAVGEDADAASHAGQFETVLDVAGEVELRSCRP